MANQKLIDYINQQFQKGRGEQKIKAALVNVGWQGKDIEEAFNFLSGAEAKPPSPPSTTVNISKLPGAAVILKDAWAIYKQRLGTFLGVMAMPILVIFLVGALTAGAGFLSFFSLVRLPSGMISTETPSPGGFIAVIGFALLAILFGIVGIVTQIWGQTALLYAIKNSDEKIGVRDAYRRGWSKILSCWWIYSLIGLIVAGGFFLLVVPGIIFAVWFSLAVFILIAEDLKGMNALLKSKEYVKGKWGGVFWRFLFIGLFALIVYGVPTFILEQLNVPSLVGKATGNIISFFLAPFVVTYLFLIYKNLKSIKGEFEFLPSRKSKVLLGLVAFMPFVIFVIGIVAVAILGAINPLAQIRKSQDAARRSDQLAIQSSLEVYYTLNHSCPPSLDELTPKYFKEIPTDPKTKLPYEYKIQSEGQSCQICVNFEEEGLSCTVIPSAPSFQQEV
ncbi:MAG TPA: hypothetical protein VMX76_00705 [Nevskiaceae bacterium]|nr:hypothetical protein [Nevskiaceae bacterium]